MNSVCSDQQEIRRKNTYIGYQFGRLEKKSDTVTFILPKMNLALATPLIHSGAALKATQLNLAVHSVYILAGFPTGRVNTDADWKNLLAWGPADGARVAGSLQKRGTKTSNRGASPNTHHQS